MKCNKLAILLIPVLCVCCTPPTAAITSAEHQLMNRQAQTRDYDQVSKKEAMKASIATLQDLNFILDRVDADLGTISASKYKGGANVKITVSVRERDSMAVTIRANAAYGTQTVEDPLIYQDFFTLLDKSLFLVKNRVD